jgi:hypothetical protein
MVQFSAEKHSLKLKPQTGDMCFINNFAIMHSRNSFVDSIESKRHILRLWLSSPEKGEKIPPLLELGYDRLFEPMGEIPNVWNLDALIERGRPRVRGNGSNSGGSSGGSGGGSSDSSSCG